MKKVYYKDTIEETNVFQLLNATKITLVDSNINMPEGKYKTNQDSIEELKIVYSKLKNKPMTV